MNSRNSIRPLLSGGFGLLGCYILLVSLGELWRPDIRSGTVFMLLLITTLLSGTCFAFAHFIWTRQHERLAKLASVVVALLVFGCISNFTKRLENAMSWMRQEFPWVMIYAFIGTAMFLASYFVAIWVYRRCHAWLLARLPTAIGCQRM